jgi:hypothetical protein
LPIMALFNSKFILILVFKKLSRLSKKLFF